MTKALRDKKIAYKLHFYKATSGTEFKYTFPGPNGKTEWIELNANGHVIVEVTVMDGGQEKTIFFDSGIGVGGSLGKGNVGDSDTGVIALENRPLKDRNGNDVLTGCGKYAYDLKQAK